MSLITIEKEELKALMLESLAELFKDGDQNIFEFYEDVMFGKIMEQDKLDAADQYEDIEIFKKNLRIKIDAL